MDDCTARFGACFSESTCSDGEKSTAYGWIFIVCQLVLSALLFLTLCGMHISKRGDDEKIIVSTGRDRFLNSITSQVAMMKSKKSLRHSGKPGGTILKPLSNTDRSERNFVKNVADATILYPSKSRPEYVPYPHLNFFEHIQTKLFVFSNDEYIQSRMVSCAALASLSSAASSTLAMLFEHERHKQDCMEGLELEYTSSTKEWFMGQKDPFGDTLDSFKFLPIFLILAYIAFLVNRWRDFMITCHTIQGNIQDVGILVGSVPADQVTKEEKKQIYKIYRLLNAAHIMCYKKFMRDEFKNDDSVYSQLVEMDLLTEKEGIHLGSMGKKVREGLCSRILCEIDVLLSLTTKKYAESKSIVLNDKICDLRGTMAKLHDTFVRDNPNEYILAMQVLVYCYILLIITGYPILMFSDNNAAFSCVQPLAFFGTFFTLVSLQMPFILFERLDNPFDAHDDINAENLVASTELALFNSMRCQFNEFRSESSLDNTGLSFKSLSSASIQIEYSMDNDLSDSITSSKCVRFG
uniref:Bestrophin homolog n=1 Tax=Chaetoceros debilis TaxID=122233 RepID=A0A7S3VDI0_9STRA